MLNSELLDKTMQHIRDHPDEWDQSKWICDTAACFAGRACLLSGYTRVPHSNNSVYIMFGPLGIYALATELLGLDPDEADELFNPDNTLDDLEEIVARLKDEEGVDA